MKKITLLLLFLCSCATAFAQTTVSGKVVDDSGIGLPGVNVIEKGTNNGSTTDFDGNYSITVADQASLVFSYVGFTTITKK